MPANLSKLAVFAGIAITLVTVRNVIAQTSDDQSEIYSAPISDSVLDDSAGPALSSPPEAITDDSRSGSAGNSHSRQSQSDPSQPRSVRANNNSPRGMTPQSNNYNGQSRYQPNSQQGSQPSFQQNAPANRPSNTASHNGAPNSQPVYQRAPRNNSSDNTSGNPANQNSMAMRNSRNQYGSQYSEMQSAGQQPRKRSGYMQGEELQPGDTQYGNRSASYQSSGNSQQRMPNGTTSSIMSGNPSSGSTTYGPAKSSSMYSGGTMAAPMPTRSSMSGSQYNPYMSTVGRQPMVTPNAVYIDGGLASESISPGRMMYGAAKPGSTMGPRSSVMQSTPAMNDSGEIIGPGQPSGSSPMMDSEPMMEGGPMMGHDGDGFINPYCNNCNGCGNCGSGYGPSCGQCGGCGDDCCDCDGCGSSGHRPYGRPWVLAPFDWLFGELSSCHRGWWWAEDLTLSAGAVNFKNIVDGGVTSSFGFQQGVNWGLPVLPELGLTAQVGYMGVESEFENPTGGSRLQSFLTAGVFHRPWCDESWDAGIVFDWLHDDFFGAAFDVAQVRGLVGWQWNRCNEIGFWFAANVIDSDAFQTLDQYNFFYRRQFCRGGDIRAWGGFTGSNGSTSGGIVGADFEVPIAKSWAINGGFNYFIPSDKGNNGGLTEESWNLGCNLVWYLGGTANCRTPYRPLFNVADNGSLITILR